MKHYPGLAPDQALNLHNIVKMRKLRSSQRVRLKKTGRRTWAMNNPNHVE